jgi:transcriptional regulator with XRE-family HTH domain
MQRLRERQGWTQDQLAEAMEPYTGTRYSVATISRWERGERQTDIADLAVLSQIFQIEAAHFMLPTEPDQEVAGKKGLLVYLTAALPTLATRAALIDLGASDTFVSEVFPPRVAEAMRRAERTLPPPEDGIEVELVTDEHGRLILRPRKDR